MEKIRIGIMGCASIAERLVIPAMLELKYIYEVKKIASRTEEKAQKFAKQFNIGYVVGYEELLKDDSIDVVYIPLPTGLHMEWISKCLDYGKHVIVEKSLTMNHQDCIDLVEQAKNKKLLLMENFMFCHHTQHQWVQENITNDTIGELRLFRSQFGFPPLNKNNFRYRKEDGGGALLDAAAYTIKASQMYLGKNLEVLNAVMYIDAEQGVDIYGNATLINPNGVVSQLSYGFDNFYQCNYEIWGSKGRIFVERAFTPKPNERPSIVLQKQGLNERVELMEDNHFVKILIYFYETLQLQNFNFIYEELLDQSRIMDDMQTKAKRIKI
jgi:dTDP-3,4-didehydro-2,6-dideoxy-alpha-D-glucose 3-reductase